MAGMCFQSAASSVASRRRRRSGSVIFSSHWLFIGLAVWGNAVSGGEGLSG